MRRCLVGIIAREINRIMVANKWRGPDRSRCHQWLVETGNDLVQVVMAIGPTNEIPGTAFNLSVTDINQAMARGNWSIARDESHHSEQQGVTPIRNVHPRHVVVS